MGLLCYLVYFKISLLGYFVNYNIEQLYDFCYTKDEIEILIEEKNKTKNAEFTE